LPSATTIPADRIRAPGLGGADGRHQDPPGAGGHRRGLMHALMLVGTFCWATNIIAGKLALQSMSALALAQVRVIGAAGIFAGLFAFWPNRPRLNLTWRDWRYLGLSAFFGITLNQLFFIGGIGKTSAAHSGLIVCLGPVMVLILSCALGLEALTPLKLFGAAVSLSGVAVLTSAKMQPGSAPTWVGDVILLVGSAVFAYYTILLKKVAGRYDALTLNTIFFVLGGVLMLPFGIPAIARVSWSSLPPQAWCGIAFLVVCGSVLAYTIYAFALTELTATRVAAFAYLQPAIAAGLGVWLLGESLTGRVVAGGVLILLGVYLTEHQSQESRTAAPGRV
jgi:drug/metabolite transporter (DMT)-like permease